jgi:hypothetical protein
VTSFLVDEMFPATVAALLRESYRRDAVHVSEVGLLSAEDAQVAATARAQGRAIVTENAADFVHEPDVILVCVLKKNLPRRGALAAALAKALDRWAGEYPNPYLGSHWPKC